MHICIFTERMMSINEYRLRGLIQAEGKSSLNKFYWNGNVKPLKQNVCHY